jgi:type I restriction enzyme S subunit
MGGEWRDVMLADVASDITVGHVGPMASEYVERGIPFLRSQNVEPLKINGADLKFITDEFHGRLKKSSLKPGDVVIVRTGKPGACAVIPSTLPVANCSDLVIVRCGPDLDPRFLAYYVNSAASHHVNSHLVGAVQQHFNVGSARTLVVRLPDLSEQRTITHILGTLDEKIELNHRMSETLEAMARALFKSWFVDFDPVRAKAQGRDSGLPKAIAELFSRRFVESELGEIPEGWTVSTVETLSIRVGMGPFGSNIKVSTFVERGVPVISGQHLNDTMLEDGTYNFITTEHAESLSSSNVVPGDIVFTHAGNIGQVSYIPDRSRYDRYVLSQRQFFLRCDLTKVSPIFMTYFFRSALGQHKLLANASQVGVPSIARPVSYLRSIPLVTPPKILSDRFECAARAFHYRISNARTESETLATLRDTLLPKLISGELRVRDAERLAAKVA